MEIRPIRNAEELDVVYRLTHDCYVEKGYCSPQPGGRLIHYPYLDNIAETMVLVAVINGQIVGSNSLTVDGPRGLHVDEDFKSECDQIRGEGRKVASCWRIVTDKPNPIGRKVVMGLIEETMRQALGLDVETCVFTFNPCLEEIYQRFFNMETVARRDSIRELCDTPAVFMRLDRRNLPENVLKTYQSRAGERVYAGLA